MDTVSITRVGQATHYDKDGLRLTYGPDRMVFEVEVDVGDVSALRGHPVGSLALKRHLGREKMARSVLSDWNPQNWGPEGRPCGVGASYEVRLNMARKLVEYWS